MNFIKVTGPAFHSTCIVCGKRMLHAPPRDTREHEETVWADTEGRPFVDYYCEVCKSVKDIIRGGRGEAPAPVEA